MKVDEKAVLTKIVRYSLRAAPSPQREAIRRMVAESAERERRLERSDRRKRNRAIAALDTCNWCGVNQAVCRCT